MKFPPLTKKLRPVTQSAPVMMNLPPERAVDRDARNRFEGRVFDKDGDAALTLQ